MLLAMLITWVVVGEPVYPSMETGQTIAYISDVGAYGLKPLFITGSVVTTVFLDLGIASERWLRHNGQLAPNTSITQKILSGLAILFAIAGSCGLILLSIFDTYHHPHLHDGFLGLFIIGYVISAIFLCAEYQRLGIHYRNHRVLRASFWIKLSFILLEVALAIAFVSCSATDHRNAAAVLEWTVAFVFTGYVLSFAVDLLPSVRTKKHVPQGERVHTAMEMGLHHHHDGRHSESTLTNNQNRGEPLTTDSAGPNTNAGYRGANYVKPY